MNMPMRNVLPGIELQLDALIFDFDGEIVESTNVKTDAFRALFNHHAAHVDEIVALHERFGGLSRYAKFELIYRDILHMPLANEQRQELGRRFAELVIDKVTRCPMVAGAQQLLEELSGRVPMVVVSGTPDIELKNIIARRGLDRYFADVHGSPPDKTRILSLLFEEHGWRPTRTLMVGDALTDFEAARSNSINFVGRVANGRVSPFPWNTQRVADLTELPSMLATCSAGMFLNPEAR